MSHETPPVLIFDDGSRVMKENEIPATEGSCTGPIELNPRGSTPIPIYYEIERISDEIINTILPDITSGDDGFLIKVALQFPDELLEDAADVSFLLDEALLSKYQNISTDSSENVPLVFILGDTTYASCCADEIGAKHLNADVIVHFGTHACLSVSETLPVIYSFGVQEWTGLEQCVETVANKMREEQSSNGKLILVGERRYHNHLISIANRLGDMEISQVMVGQVPISNAKRYMRDTSKRRSCCKEGNEECCRNNHVEPCDVIHAHTEDVPILDSFDSSNQKGCIIGGLYIPVDKSSLHEFTLLYIGDDSGNSKSRQFLNTVLKCSSTDGTKACWSFNPETQQLSTDPMSILGISRHVNRRFYLTQKAKLANVIGILVGTLSQDRFQSVVSSVRKKIEDSGRAAYTFCVGKINIAKLANFGEIECFVLISCGETSVLKDEREFHVPIITPLELYLALGEKDWNGSASCGTDFNEFLEHDQELKHGAKEEDDNVGSDGDLNVNAYDDDDDNDDDEPFFSPITGTYVSNPMSLKQSSHDVSTMPGGGQMTEYKSEAAEYWKKREYKGLEANIGKDEAKPAILGQSGIASDYGNK